MLWFFKQNIEKIAAVLIIALSASTQAKTVKKQRYVGLNGCEIMSALEYECCADVNLANTPQTDYCVDLSLIPNELTLNLDLKINGDTFYNGKIDPSIAPICPPSTPLCLAVNHVNLANREVCTKLTIGPLTLLKFPCVGIQNGQIVVQPNKYVRK